MSIVEVDAQHAAARATGPVWSSTGSSVAGSSRARWSCSPENLGIGGVHALLDVAARAARGGAPGGGAHYPLCHRRGVSAPGAGARAERIEALATRLYLASETDLAVVLGQIAALRPSLVVVDSVQDHRLGRVDGAAGNVTQVREVAMSLYRRGQVHRGLGPARSGT